MRGAHRVAWIHAFGEIPSGLSVLHHCDTPLCVNPSHLFLGTNAENVKDKIRKRRQVQGDRVPQAKLTVLDIQQIRSLNQSQNQIARQFGVTQSTISAIIRREAWKHVP
jgi:hypothetical protein